MHSERRPSSRRIRFKITEACDKKIKEIDKQKEASLRWHISKMEKIRNKKWKSLIGPPPGQKETIEPLKQEEIPPDIAVTRATSFYAWGEANSGHNRSIITATKPPDDLLDVSSEDITFSEVTKFYQEGTESYDNSNSLLRLYPKDTITPPKKCVTKTHIYIPYVNREGRVVREGVKSESEEVRCEMFDSNLEVENGRINLVKFKENLQKLVPQLGKVNKVPTFPEPILNRPRQSLADLIHQIEQRKSRIPNIRSRSNSRLSQALREMEDEPVATHATHEEDTLLCLDDDGLLPGDLSKARVSSILEREDKSQTSTLFIKGSESQLSKISCISSAKRREESLNLSLSDMQELHYVRKIGNRELSKHDTFCGCDRFSNSSKSKRSLCSNSGMEI